MSATRVDQLKLSQREQSVLKALIREHVRTGKPVGSRRLAKICREGVSPATIRNVMADLEELRLVSQPHASAGRVPTTDGYRYYVGCLLHGRKLSEEDTNRIRRSLEGEVAPGELMSKTSQLLSSLSNNIGIVLAPPISQVVMKHIEFLKLGADRILVIMVSGSGIVQNKLVKLDERFDQVELDQAGRYLIGKFSGKNLMQIRHTLLQLMSEEKALYDEILHNSLALGLAAVDGGENEEAKVYLGGAAKLVRTLETSDWRRLSNLFETFEEKSRLVKLIAGCIHDEPAGPTVKIGLERHLPGMRHWTLITSPYRCDDQTIGSVAILGPARMEYEKTISLVDYVARLFGQILSEN